MAYTTTLQIKTENEWCGGRDLNSRTPTRMPFCEVFETSQNLGPQPSAFNLAGQPPHMKGKWQYSVFQEGAFGALYFGVQLFRRGLHDKDFCLIPKSPIISTTLKVYVSSKRRMF